MDNQEDTYEFTQDWFHWAPEVWEQIKPLLPERKRFLEVGAFEGRSTVWTVENMMDDGGVIVAIDTWSGGEEHSDMQIPMQDVERRFDSNAAKVMQKHPSRYVIKYKEPSFEILSGLRSQHPFDFIYIDGSHVAADVITDAVIAFRLLKVGGVMVFDDYMWGDARDILHRPKIAIDAFSTMFAEHLQILHVGYQYVVKRVD